MVIGYPLPVDCDDADALHISATRSSCSLSLPSSSSSSSAPPPQNTFPISISMATTTTFSTLSPALPQNYASTPPHRSLFPSLLLTSNYHSANRQLRYDRSALPSNSCCRRITCKATEVSVAEESSPSGGGGGGGGENWVPVVPVAALPRGERRVIIQDGEEILLLWYKDQIYAIENRSPAEGAYTEGLINAKLTQDGCIVCPSTDSTFDLQSGAIKEWYPKNPVLRVLTPALRSLFVYPVKTDEENIYISVKGLQSYGSAEIVFSGKAQPGVTATDVNVDEVKMVVDEETEGFGFIRKNEIINGKAAVIGFLLLIDFELLTGKGILKGTGFLDFLYSASSAFK